MCYEPEMRYYQGIRIDELDLNMESCFDHKTIMLGEMTQNRKTLYDNVHDIRLSNNHNYLNILSMEVMGTGLDEHSQHELE